MRALALFIAGVCAAVSGGAANPPTFNKDVMPILQQQCQTCHRPGDIGPFSLMDYQSALPYALSITNKVQTRQMPPWKPAPGVGDFQDPRILTPAQINTIVNWVDAGAPEGDPKDLPAAVVFSSDWTLGQPDLVLSMPEDFPVPAGGDLYRCFSLPTNLANDQFLSAVEIKPGNRAIVHHALLFADTTGASIALDNADPGQGYTCFGGPGFTPDTDFFGGWVPGLRPVRSMPGFGMRLRAGSHIVMQIHYHPRSDLTDRTQIGLYFSTTPVDKIVRALPIANTSFKIPAGDPHYRVDGGILVPPGFDSHAVWIAPHMHLLGRQIQAQAAYANRSVVPLIEIDDWDFHWQGIYQYRQPVAIPGATQVAFTAHYDNSANNAENPNSPPVDVSWGELTVDEMALVFVGFTLDAEHLAPPQASVSGLVNAASFVGGPSAAGAIVSLFGSGLGSSWETASTLPLPKTLAKGVRVTVGGMDAPLFYASPAQINFQVPFEATGFSTTVTVTRSEDGARQSFTLPLADAHPGIFTLTSDGQGPAAALHADGSVTSGASPAARGEWLALYATGLGPVTPPAQSGAAPAALSNTVKTVSVTVGGVSAEVNFAGLAPGFAGLYQVNFRVPPTAPAGPEVPLSLTVANVQSNTVKLAIQ